VRDHVLTILSGLRRRMLAVRAAEAAAVGGVAGGLTCAFVMAARIVAARQAAAAGALCAVPLLAGAALLAFRRTRARLELPSPLRWYAAGLPAAVGAAGVASVLTGAFVRVPKNWLFGLVPAGAALAAILVLIRGATMRAVAASVDRRARLRERLSTACELAESVEDAAFARAVRDQALAAAGRRDLRRVSFWSRTPATLGALGLAVAAAALMLPWEPLEPPEAVLGRRWQQVSAQAGKLLQQPLEMLDVQRITGNANVATAVRQLRELAERLRSGEPTDAKRWRGEVVELQELAAALRQAVKTGQLDADAAAQISQLIQTLDQVADEITGGMAGAAPGPARVEDTAAAQTPPRQPSEAAPVGYATVYNPGYSNLISPATDTAPAAHGAERPTLAQVPYDQAWAAAQRRAAEALSSQDVPGEYRQLIRDFFAKGR
jgi:hypothetical protein